MRADPYTIERKRGLLRSQWVIMFKGEECGKLLTRGSDEQMDELLVGLNTAYWHGFRDGNEDDNKWQITFQDRY